jgi:hypothetical protein
MAFYLPEGLRFARISMSPACGGSAKLVVGVGMRQEISDNNNRSRRSGA